MVALFGLYRIAIRDMPYRYKRYAVSLSEKRRIANSERPFCRFPDIRLEFTSSRHKKESILLFCSRFFVILSQTNAINALKYETNLDISDCSFLIDGKG